MRSLSFRLCLKNRHLGLKLSVLHAQLSILGPKVIHLRLWNAADKRD